MPSKQYLIADADEGQRQLLDLLLADGHSAIVAVENARQALEFLRENTPSLVVISQELPDMPGTAVCKRLKAVQRLANVPVIVTTEPPGGLGVSLDMRQVAEQAGVDLLLPKPLGDKALKERARRLMQEAEAAAASGQGAPRRRFGTTAVIDDTIKELDGTAATPGSEKRAAARAADDLTVEIERLRDENVKLKRKLLAAQESIERLRTEVDDLKRRRGPFGRRR